MNEYEQIKKKNKISKVTEKDLAFFELDLTLVGIYALHDPMRSEIKESVQICRNAGFTVRMVTGENIGTAKTIAIKAGILPELSLIHI